MELLDIASAMSISMAIPSAITAQDYDNKTPSKKMLNMMEDERLLDKINILTMKHENQPNNAKLPTIKDFAIIKPISRGAFGKVFLGYKNNDPDKLYAIKVMRKSDMINKNMVSQVITERNALALSRSPFCVSLFYSLQSLNYVYLVMEYMVGGDLKSLLAMYGYFDETAARFYAAEVALALQYLHSHGIVHRDIKPDNMLISASGHVKLTDFGLSKIELRRDLEISDLINCSPNLNARTPGQLLSLTSHLSFGSEKKSHFISIINKQNVISESEDSEADTSLNELEKTSNESKISGVSPFLSAEEFNISIVHTCNNNVGDSSSSSSYHTCTSGELSKSIPAANSTEESRAIAVNKVKNTNRRVEFCVGNNNNNNNDGVANEAAQSQCDGCKYDKNAQQHENDILKIDNNQAEDTSFEFSMRIRTLKGQEDSGVSSRKSDYSNSHLNAEITSFSMDKTEALSNLDKDEFNSSDYSRSYNINNTNETSDIRMHSPFRNLSRNFKRPDFLRNSFNRMKRKLHLLNRSQQLSCSNSNNNSHNLVDADGSSGSAGSSTTGLTQEIDLLDIGSSTPKKRKAKSPIRGVLKVRSLSDEEAPLMPHQMLLCGEQVTNVVFSTPVSSQKMPRLTGGLLGKLKATRFALPPSHASVEVKGNCDKAGAGAGHETGVDSGHAKDQGDAVPSSSASNGGGGVQYLKITDDPTMSPIDVVASSVPKTPKNVHTPFRTPKSVRRGAVRASSERILGTPDYLAPELLMRHGHGPAVDWWALGVCLYEFLTGIPPFNDETPQKVFDNILNKNIEWPEGNEALSVEAMEAVDLMLTMDPAQRPAAKEVQCMRFFQDIDWEHLIREEPPFVPTPDDPTDTGYFDARNNLQHLKLSNFVLEE